MSKNEGYDVTDAIDDATGKMNEITEGMNLSGNASVIDKDLLENGFVTKFIYFFTSNGSIIYTGLFIAFLFTFSTFIDSILINYTDSPKSAVFIKYAVRWWIILFCSILVLNLILGFRRTL